MEGGLFILICIISKVYSACSPKGLSFVNFQKTRQRSKPFVIAVIHEKCPEMSEVYYEWRVKQIDGPAVQTAKGSSITVDGYEYSSDDVFAKPYNVTVRVSHYEDMHVSESISETFQFIPEKIHLEITGGLSRSHSIHYPLIIDAESSSRDLSYPRGEHEFERDDVKCSVTPELPGFEVPNRLRFTVPANFLQLNKKYTFRVEVKRTKIPNFVDSQKATQDVFVYDPFDEIFSSSSNLTRQTRIVHDGSCEIDPKQGTSAVTLFKINCTGFSTDTGFIRFLVHQKGTWEGYGTLLCVSDEPVMHLYLVAGSAQIIVRVIDGRKFELPATLSADVAKYKPPGRSSLVHTIKDIIFGTFNYSIPTMVKRHEINKATQMIAAFSTVINDLNTTLLKEEVQVLYKRLAQCAADLPIFDYDIAVQRLTLVRKLITDLPFFHTPTNRILSKSLVHAARGFREFSSPRSTLTNRNVSFLLITTAEELIYLKREHPPSENRIPPHEYDTYEDFVDHRVQIADDMDTTAVYAITSIDIAACVDAKTLNIGEKEHTLGDEHLKVRYRTMWTRDIPKIDPFFIPFLVGNATLNFNEEFVKFIEKQTAYFSYIAYSLGLNPFWWRTDNHKLYSGVFSYTMDLNCKTLSSPPRGTYKARIFVKKKPIVTTYEGFNLKEPEVFRLPYYTIENYALSLIPGESPTLYTLGRCYCTEKDYLRGEQLIRGVTILMLEYLPRNAIYICFRKVKHNDPNETYGYIFRSTVLNCVRWDPDIADWTSNGIFTYFSFISIHSATQCEPNHLSIFALFGWKSFATKVNNTKLDFRIAKDENYTILIILIPTLLLWLMLMFCAWLKDKRSEITNLVWTLDDNVPGDKHAYLVVVFTGSFIDAGTTADVAIQLLGKKKNSRVHVIRTRGLTVLARNTQDWFVMYSPHYLGKLNKIRLWHNCKGKMPHWYCERVLVRHLRSGEQYCFIVEKWFSLIWGDGKICREIAVVDECHKNFQRRKFCIWLQRNFHDSHWFLSIFMRDRQSNFGSVDRVGVLMAFFYTFMLVSAMTDWIPVFGPEDSIDDKSTFFFNLRDVGMFLLCLILSTPLPALLQILFRHSAPQHHSLFIRRGRELSCESLV